MLSKVSIVGDKHVSFSTMYPIHRSMTDNPVVQSHNGVEWCEYRSVSVLKYTLQMLLSPLTKRQNTGERSESYKISVTFLNARLAHVMFYPIYALNTGEHSYNFHFMFCERKQYQFNLTQYHISSKIQQQSMYYQIKFQWWLMLSYEYFIPVSRDQSIGFLIRKI